MMVTFELQFFNSLLSLFIFTLIFSVLQDLYKKRRILIFSKQLKGYTFYPVVGNGLHFIGKDILTVFRDLVRKFNLPCNMWIGHTYYYITADAEEVKVTLTHPNAYEKADTYKQVHMLFENTLPMEPHDKWKKDRKIFSRSFRQQILNSFMDTFNENCEALVDVLKESHSRNKLDTFARFALKNVGGGIAGLDVQMNKETNLTRSFATFQYIIGRRIMNPFLPESVFKITNEGRMLYNSLNVVKKALGTIIQVKRNEAKETKGQGDEDDEELPLLDLLMKHDKTFSEEDISQHMIAFILAATETSAFTLAFTCTLLAMNPECQAKVYEEVMKNVGADKPISYDDLPNLKYTERALLEGMRIFPVVPFIARYVSADLDLGKRKIPAGSNIIISIIGIHRSEKYWKNPLKYEPDRFLPEEVAKRHAYCYLPFSLGPRNCIGMKYSMMMMKTALAHIIRRYELKSNCKSIEDVQLTTCMTMRAVPDVDCQFVPRQR